jgi:hypothetical protein
MSALHGSQQSVPSLGSLLAGAPQQAGVGWSSASLQHLNVLIRSMLANQPAASSQVCM